MKKLGKIDTITKEYMKDPVIFADMFNKFLYHGKQVINPDNLIEMDSTEIVVPYGEGKAEKRCMQQRMMPLCSTFRIIISI